MAIHNSFFSDDEHPKKQLSPKQAMEKAARFCAYQERSQHEVRQRLYDFGLYPNEVEECISELITQGFINEERFALAYAGGKFRMKGWGKVKIASGLKAHKISDYCMKKALLAIDPDAYYHQLEKLATKKWESLKGKKEFERKQLAAKYLQSKGYESDLIWDVLAKLSNS